MQLRDLGEFGLIDRIARAGRAPPGLARRRARDRRRRRAAADARRRAGGRQHRRLLRGRALPAAEREPAHDRAARAGGEPLGSGGDGRAPARLPARAGGAARTSRAHAWMRWSRACSTRPARYGCPLVGGNLSRARELSLTITVIGAVARGRALRRDVARAGRPDLRHRHAGRGRPRAGPGRARAGARASRAGARGCARAGRSRRWAGGSPASTSRTGSTPTSRTCSKAGRWRAEIEAARIPVPPGFRAACARAGLDPERARARRRRGL